MITDYSKSLKDLTKEESIRVDNEKTLLVRQHEANLRLANAPLREHCVLCATQLTGEEFLHRKVPFISCKICGHIQTKAQPPIGFPDEIEKKDTFTKIYPKLEKKEFEDRKKRIYLPKLNWILSALERSGYDRSELLRMSWMELGSGEGAFLSSLQDQGVTNFIGFEREKALVDRSKSFVSKEKVKLSIESIGETVRKTPVQIICAFFVFEHDENLPYLINALRDCQPGTILCFSVPMFGLSCLLENIATDRYARSLDAAIHVQTFTDQSIDFLFSVTNFEQIARWQFGQDALELSRLLRPLEKKISHFDHITAKLSNCIDDIQATVDKHNLCDQIHLIAKKR